MTPKSVVLFSGGVDSFCLAEAVKPDALVYFDLGLPENQRELEHMKQLKIAENLIVDDSFKIGKYKLANEVLPFRNAFLIMGAFYHGSKIYLGATSSSTNRDKNDIFAGKLLDLAKYISHEPHKNPEHLREEDMEIILPFKTKTKTQFVSEFIANGGEVNELLKTRSCYDSHEKECGKCQSCIRKYMAFTNNNLPTDFINDPAQYLVEQKEKVIALGQMDVADEVQQCLDKI